MWVQAVAQQGCLIIGRLVVRSQLLSSRGTLPTVVTLNSRIHIGYSMCTRELVVVGEAVGTLVSVSLHLGTTV